MKHSILTVASTVLIIFMFSCGKEHAIGQHDIRQPKGGPKGGKEDDNPGFPMRILDQDSNAVYNASVMLSNVPDTLYKVTDSSGTFTGYMSRTGYWNVSISHQDCYPKDTILKYDSVTDSKIILLQKK